jgi:ATP-dependent helicase/nuclease subunit A
MTIHQAKGLEYPVVYLPYLNQKLMIANRSGVYFDDYWGVISNVSHSFLNSQNPVQDSYYLYDLQKLGNKTKEIAELKRLFYVGCTRARDHLVLCGEMNRNKIPPETPLSWLMESLNLSPDNLSEDHIEISSGLSIQVHRTYVSVDSIQEKERKKTIQSLDELSRIMPGDKKNIEQPVFLRKTIDKPEGELFSATQLMTFIEDREEYYKRYHLGFFEDDYEKLGMGKTSETDALLRGTLLHKLMESFPSRNIDQLLDEVDLSDEVIKNKLMIELAGLVKQIDKSQVIKSCLKAKDYKNEVSILRQIGSDFITGTLDRIFKNENNDWVVLDYKTNHISSADVSYTAEKYQVQLETYALLISSIYPKQNIYPICLYFIYPDVLHTEVFDTDRLKTVEKKFKEVIENIKKYYPYTDKSVY